MRYDDLLQRRFRCVNCNRDLVQIIPGIGRKSREERVNKGQTNLLGIKANGARNFIQDSQT